MIEFSFGIVILGLASPILAWIGFKLLKITYDLLAFVLAPFLFVLRIVWKLIIRPLKFIWSVVSWGMWGVNFVSSVMSLVGVASFFLFAYEVRRFKESGAAWVVKEFTFTNVTVAIEEVADYVRAQVKSFIYNRL